MRISDLRSPGLATDVEIARFEGVLTERPGYLVVETPGNPGFYWGNFLIYPAPPAPSDEPVWREDFRREFAHQPLVRHQAFSWDGSGEGAPFAGFTRESGAVLTAREVRRPPRAHPGAVVRPLRTDAEWEAAVLNQIECREEGFTRESYEPFKRAQMARYRRMSEAGLGDWYGAFLDGELAADCGLFVFGETGRFQAVETRPDLRRRGLAAALLHEAARAGLRRARELVIVSEQVHGAERLYRSAGFSGDERTWQLTLRPDQP